MEAGFLSRLAGIILVDLVLSGDNAVVIALAVKPLRKEQRRKGILYGAAAAVALRVFFTFCVAQLLRVPLVKLAGGLLILWIAVKLFVQDEAAQAARSDARNVAQAVRLIVLADISMSLDNMLAVGGLSNGDPLLLGIGLAVTVPCLVVASDALSRLMERYPWIVYAGAAVLGKVGAEMILTDPLVRRAVAPSHLLVRAAEVVAAVAIIAFGLSRRAARNGREPA